MKRFFKILTGIVSGILLLGLLSAGVLQLGKLYINVLGRSEVLQEIPSGADPGSTGQVLTLPRFTVHYLQFGIFANRENADKLARELEAKGTNCEVLEGKSYRVVGGYFGELLPTLVEKNTFKGSIKPVEKNQTVNGLSFKVTAGEGENAAVMLANYAEIMETVAKVYATSDPAKLKSEELRDLLAKTKGLQAGAHSAAVKLSQSKNNSVPREIAVALDSFGQELVQDMERLAGAKTKQNYSQSQKTMLKLLNIYLNFEQSFMNNGR